MRRFKLIFSILFISALCLSLQLVPTSAATLDQIRLSWQHDPRTTMTIMWRTDSTLIPRVQYGTTVSYGNEATGTSQSAILDGYVYHTVELIGLTPGAVYHYRVSGPGNSWSSDASFRTAPQAAADFSFTIFGDNGTQSNGGTAPNRIKDLVAAQNPAFHLVAGDLTYADGDSCSGRSCVKEHWEEWFKELERFSHTVPIMPAIGNHEIKSDVKFDSGETYYERSFALPSQPSELYYSFDYGDVHFVALDSNDWRSLRRGGAQYSWLQSDLAATSKRFKIVYFHHLAYTSGGDHEDTEAIQQEVTPLFDQFDVDLVLYGHNHHFERTFPIRYNAPDTPTITSTNPSAYTGSDGVIYMTTGGGGRGIYNFGTAQPAWSAVRCECHEIVRVEVDDAGILTVTTIKIDGSILDRFTINKSSAPSSPPPFPPSSPSNPSQTQSLPTTSYVLPTQQTIRGFNFAVWWHDILEKESTRRSIDTMKATGANYFALAPFWYQDNKTAVAIVRRPDKTATDSSVRSSIRYAKSLGLKVALKPMVDSKDGTWRGQLAPLNVDAWFQSYKEFILNYARIAQEEGVDYFVVGTEFASLTKPMYSNNWRAIIRAVRDIYHGPITYAANWGKRHEGEYYQIDFWDALDAIGIDAYFPLAENDAPTVQSIVNAWTSINSGGTLSVPNSHAERGGAQNWFQDIKALHERFNKPVIFTEIGYLSCDGTGKKPWEYPCGTNLDAQEQADLYEGTLTFWKDYDWMQGYLFWRWDADPNKGGTSDKDYLVAGKPTVDVLRRFWTIQPSVPSIPSPQPALPAGRSSPTRGEEATANSSVSSVTAGTTQSLLPTTPDVLYTQPPFAYGKPRLPYPATERAKAWELSLALKIIFNGRIPIRPQHWHIYVNAYIYGGYSPEVVAQSLRLHGKVVHPSIPWSAWRNSRDYRQYMR